MIDLLLNTAAHGFGAHDLALAVVRVAVGLFFAIAGFNKLFDANRHASLVKSLEENKLPCIWLLRWWVPGWEMVAGAMLAIGLFSAFSAGVLAIICIVAILCEASKKVAAYQPINAGDVVADYLYLPEVLYLVMLTVNILAGTGVYSLDAILFPL